MKYFYITLLTLILAGCTTSPPRPPIPYGTKRIAINPDMTYPYSTETKKKRCCA